MALVKYNAVNEISKKYIVSMLPCLAVSVKLFPWAGFFINKKYGSVVIKVNIK